MHQVIDSGVVAKLVPLLSHREVKVQTAALRWEEAGVVVWWLVWPYHGVLWYGGWYGHTMVLVGAFM